MTVNENRTQVVLLGASNLVLGWPELTQQLQKTIPGHMDVLVACGMGRSYVSWSGFGIRRLPGIQSCGLWNRLNEIRQSTAQSGSNSTPAVRVLMTDVGNDLVYGRTPEETIAAVRNSLDQIRCEFPGADVVITELPMDSVQQLGNFRYYLTRSLLFAGCRLSLPDIKFLAAELNARLVELCEHQKIPHLRPKAEWYGFDPIHVLKKYRTEAFAEYIRAWDTINHSTPQCADQAATGTALSLPRPTAELRLVWGQERRTTQPSITSGPISVFSY